MGVEDLSLDWSLPVPESARREAAGFTSGSPYLLMSMCQPRLRNFRNWSAEGYATVVEHAWVQHGLKTVLTGGGSTQEREMGQRIAAQAQPGAVIDAIGESSLKGLLALIDGARAVIAPDSGPVHMANAMGTPTVGLFATTNPERAGPIAGRISWSIAIPRRCAPTCTRILTPCPGGSVSVIPTPCR